MTDPAPTTRRRSSTPRTLLLASFVAIGVFVGPAAGAHGGETALEVVARTPGPERSITYDVRLEFEDGHAVEDATVTAVGESADGTTVGPVEMAVGPEPGRYVATLEFPSAGAWTVRFSSADPEVTATLPETVDEAAPTMTPAEGSTTTTAVGSTDASTSSAAGPVGDSGGEEATDDVSSTSTGLWVALGAVAAVVLLGTFLITRRGKRDDT